MGLRKERKEDKEGKRQVWVVWVQESTGREVSDKPASPSSSRMGDGNQ